MSGMRDLYFHRFSLGPQRLKPEISERLIGTAEAVP